MYASIHSFMLSTSGSQYEVLQVARDAAKNSRNYCSLRTRENLVTSFKAAFNGLEPHRWQLDVAEAILLNLDCIAIVGTGSGKTMPFAMPLLVDRTEKKIVIVISPLNDLEEDQVNFLILFLSKILTLYAAQARRFRKIGLSATAVNGDVWNNVLQEVRADAACVISPSVDLLTSRKSSMQSIG